MNDSNRHLPVGQFMLGGLIGLVAAAVLLFGGDVVISALEPIDVATWERFAPSIGLWLPITAVVIASLVLASARKLPLAAGSVLGALSLYLILFLALRNSPLF
jgi:hypothetical protein